MSSVQVRVPGKVMLSGEYAVLHGGTAVLATVDRWLTLTEAESPLESTPVVDEAFKEPIPELEAHEKKSPLKGLAVDRSEFIAEDPYGDSVKLGIGSSAAEAVGTIALRFERAGMNWRENRRRIAELADTAHNRAQGGRGSGADVWASALQQPISFRLGLSGPEADQVADLASPTTPLTLLWTGEPADTRELVGTFESWLDRDSLADGLLARLVDASEELAPLWFGSNAGTLYAGLDQFTARMRECADAAGLPWMLPLHEELMEWAEENGGRAKPTGAGGGDLILLAGELPFAELESYLLIPLNL